MRSVDLVLVGRPVSNYVNIVRAALLEKDIPHRHVASGASQDPEFLARSPMGKVPVLETQDGFLAETIAILDYLDDRYPKIPLRPASPFARAKMRQALNVLQVYFEVPARSLYPHVFAGAKLDPTAGSAVRVTLDRATAALRQLVSGDEFLSGGMFSQLDAFAFYTFELVERVCRFVWNRSPIDELGLAAWRERVARRASSRAILLDFNPALEQYLIDHGASQRAQELFRNA